MSFDLIGALALAVALGFDAFAVAVAIGTRRPDIDRWAVFRLSWHFGFAQFGMPVVGWVAGGVISTVIGSFGQWLAALILLLIGGRLILDQFKPDERKWDGDPTRLG